MSSTTDYEQLLPEIRGIASADVLSPNMPIDVFVQEAENLSEWCKADKSLLTQKGLSADLLDALPLRAGACRQAQSLWMKERNMRKEAEQQWSEKSPAAFDLRNELVHGFRFAFRNDASLLGRVDEIAEGDTNADMVQDLNDLAALGRSNLTLLTAIGLTEDLLDKAAASSDEMASILAASNGEHLADNDILLIRNQAYSLLKRAVDEIRSCGKYVFWRTPARLKGYSSPYWQKQRAGKADSPVNTEGETA